MPQEIKYLVDAQEAQIKLWVFCVVCGHAQKMHPWLLCQHGGGLQTFEQAAKKCRCRKCGRRDALIMPSRDYTDAR